MAAVEAVENNGDGSREKLSHHNAEIWVVEDHPAIRKGILSELKEVGYTNIKAFADGQEAWEAFEKACLQKESRLPNLIITDMDMPHMNGMALLKKINSCQHSPLPIFVLLSANITPETAKIYEGEGFFAAIPKSNVEELMLTIPAALSHYFKKRPASH